ncbi:MAG: RNA polymerase factor sigma-54 [Candidatus Omnitrophota bacterium]
MAIKQRLLQKQLQKMIMTAKMQQSMHILQLPIVELDQLIEEEMANNPVLEQQDMLENQANPDNQDSPAQNLNSQSPADQEPKIRSAENINLEFEWLDSDHVWFSDFFDKNKVSQSIEKHNFQETLITKNTTLQQELLQQFRIINDQPQMHLIAEEIIGNIADNGYLVTPLEEIAKSLNITIDMANQVLTQIQTLEPAGIGARDLKECLLLQLKRQNKENSPEAAIVKNFLPELAKRKYSQISKALKMTLGQVKKCTEKISSLDPKPCRNYATEALRIVPDVILEKTPEGFEIIINSKNLPRLSISGMYKKLLKEKNCPKETLEYIREKLKTAENLISGLNQREQTLKKVTQSIIEFQSEFIEKGILNLKPLTLKDIALKLDIHSSTVSRTIANKYIQTPYGTFELKNFFSQAINSQAGELSNQKIKATIDELIKTEPAHSPLTDQELVNILKEKGMHISRRTVTKYRNALKIPAAHLRRK